MSAFTQLQRFCERAIRISCISQKALTSYVPYNQSFSHVKGCAGRISTPAQHRAYSVVKESQLQRLAARIADASTTISQFCKDNKHPQNDLAMGEHAPATLLPSDASRSMVLLQQQLLDAAVELQLLTTDTVDVISSLASKNHQFACVRWLCHFHVPSHVPLSVQQGTPSGLPYSEVASLAKVPEHQLRSIARMAMLINFFREPSPGLLAHSSFSAALARDPELLALATFTTSVSAPMVYKMVEATERWGKTELKTQSAYNIAWDTDLPLFAHVGSDEELSEKYATYMRAQSRSRGMSLEHVVKGFDWEKLEEGLVVDVGGSLGQASLVLVAAFPRLSTVVQDLSETIHAAVTEFDASRSARSAALSDRVVFQAHSFFEPQPPLPVTRLCRTTLTDRPNARETEVQRVDSIHHPLHKPLVYFLRMILHDWRDPDARTILRHLAAVLRTRAESRRTMAVSEGSPKDRILVMDIILPVPLSTTTTTAAAVAATDADTASASTLANADNALVQNVDSAVTATTTRDDLGPSRTQETLLRVRDLTMLQAHNSQEREMVDWEELIESVGSNGGDGTRAWPRLRIVEVHRPVGSAMGILELALSDAT